MRTVYFDCFSGAAGDMILGALLDAGASESDVRAALGSLGLEGARLEIDTVAKGALRATKATVVVEATSGSRRLADITDLLNSAALDPRVRDLALAAFAALARAEARSHGVEEGEVHLHEVGALDAIVDIVGSCAALFSLGAQRVTCSPVPLGGGIATSSHGPIPVPAPAALEILAERGAVVEPRGDGELVTPTGAALLATFVDDFVAAPSMQLHSVGYGAGDTDREVPNVLRVIVGESDEMGDALWLVETNLDDMSSELLAHALDALLTAGAVDAWLTPVLMKKGRPAHTLSALVARDKRDDVVAALFYQTTTFGVRFSPVERDVLVRDLVRVDVQGHPIAVKLGRRDGRVISAAPEYEDALGAANATGLALSEVYARATIAARSLLEG